MNINKTNNTIIKLTEYLSFIFVSFLIINFNFYPTDLIFSRVFVLSAIVIVIIVKFPSKIKYIDYILIILTILATIFSYFYLYEFIEFLGMGTPLYQIICATLFVFIVYESTRRVAGPVLPIMALILTGYALYRGYPYARVITEIFSYDGIYGTVFFLVTSVIFMFMLFGNILTEAKFGDFLLKFGNALVGGTSGGPAKIAVISSGLFGTISGSAVANVVGTGTFTIPMMKKMGFAPHVAGGVEAIASTGGLIMPPVMAAAAFLMAEILQVPYLQVCKAAILPAIAFYVAVFMGVDAYSKKMGLKGLPKNERPSLIESLKEGGHLLLALFFLIFLLIKRIEPMRCAFLTCIALFPISYIFKRTRMNLKKTYHALVNTADNLLIVGSCCATIGSIIACIAVTGLGGRIANYIVGFGGQNVYLLMFLVMITCLIFGLALPATASYLVLIAIVGPALTRILNPMASHLFILYYAALSGVTPPVAMAAYAAAAIAKANMFKTAFSACKLGIISFIVPYVFIRVPAMVMEGNYPNILLIVFCYVLAMPISIAWGVWGQNLIKKISYLERIFYLIAGSLLIYTALINKFTYSLFIAIVWLIGAIYFNHLWEFLFVKKKLFIINDNVRELK